MNDEALSVLSHYRLGAIRRLASGGGTAGKTWRIDCGSGRLLLRRRGRRTSAPAWIERDHRLRRFLLAHDLPTALPLETADGRSYVLADVGAYELYPLIAGHFIRRDRPEELSALARTLARFHQTTAAFRAELPALEIDQFGAAIPGAPTSFRIDDPAAMRDALRRLPEPADAAERQALGEVAALAGELAEDYGADVYRRVDRFVTHGDLNFSNLLFGDDGEVAGLFDFDWTMPGARLRDVADALHFFAGGLPADSDCGNIWDLTGQPRFDRERSRLFLDEYQARLPLDSEERRLLPAAWKARVLAFHIEGMAKVPAERRLEFLTRNFPAFLRGVAEVLGAE